MGQVWDLVLTPAKQTVLLALADHADHNGENVKPGAPLVAWKTGYSERQVQRIMADLEADGLLIKVQTRAGLPTVYRIDLQKGVQKQPYKARKTHDKMSGVQSVTPDKMTYVNMSPTTFHAESADPTPDIASANLTSIPLKDEPSLKDQKEENARESSPLPAGLSHAIERAAQDVYQPIDNDTAAQMQGDVLMRRYEATCKQLGAPQTLNRRDTRLRRIAAQYYRDTYTPDEVQAAVEAGYADGKLIPFQFLGEKMGALRIPKPALVKGARPVQAAPAQKAAPSEPEKQTFDPQTWVRREIAKGTFDPSVPPVVKVKTHVHA